MGDLNFIEGIEGYCGEPKECKMLIILREHGGEEGATNDFWFSKNVVENQDRAGAEKRYYNILGALAAKILNITDEQEALKKCAFINLAPFWGGKMCNDNKGNTGRFLGEGCVFDMFKNTALKDKKQIKINKDSNAQDIAKQRLCLINQAIESKVKYILTVREIYDAICEKYGVEKSDQKKFEFKSKGKTRNFKWCEINNTKIYSFYHPSYAGIGYDNLQTIEIPT